MKPIFDLRAVRRRLIECDRSQELPEWARDDITKLIDHADRQATALQVQARKICERKVTIHAQTKRLHGADTAVRAVSDRARELEEIIRKARRCMRNDNITAAIETLESTPVPETLVDWTRMRATDALDQIEIDP